MLGNERGKAQKYLDGAHIMIIVFDLKVHVISVRNNGKGFDEKEIAEKHGGNAWAESTVETGTIFYISVAKNLH